MRLVPLYVLLGALSACGPATPADPLPFEPASATAAPDPAKPGPFPVGVRTVTYEDTGRRKPDGSPRLLVTEIWYPATQATRGQPGVSYDVRSVFTEAQVAALSGVEVPLLETAAVRDAPLATEHGPFPLIVFAHGQGAVRWQSTYYTVTLASHGYVVISTDHEGGTLYDLVRGNLQNVAVGLETRPVDVRYLLNRMERLKPEEPLYGHLDLGHIGVTGHSFGALTSFRVGAEDPRVKAIVPQAPTDVNLAWLGLPQPVKLNMPVMVQAAHRDQTLEWDSNIVPTWPLLERPRWLVDLVQGGHFTFSDLCAFDLASIAERVSLDVMGADVRKVLEDGCAAPAPPASVAQPVINHFGVAFFNAHLRGSEGSKALLTQERGDAAAGAPGVVAVTADP
ncbi:MAG: lipase [Myxococcaceae bacterium]